MPRTKAMRMTMRTRSSDSVNTIKPNNALRSVHNRTRPILVSMHGACVSVDMLLRVDGRPCKSHSSLIHDRSSV